MPSLQTWLQCGLEYPVVSCFEKPLCSLRPSASLRLTYCAAKENRRDAEERREALS